MVIVIGMVGKPATGKSTFARELAKKLNLTHIDTDKMRDIFIDNFKYFNNADYSYSNDLIASVNRVVRPTTMLLMQELLDQNVSFIIDGYGKTKVKRDRLRELFKKHAVTQIIVYTIETEEVIIKRLEKKTNGTQWVENYLRKWKPTFNEPTKEECDYLIEVKSDNHKEAIDKIKGIVNNQ
ncbi:ATP-binding protein [Candidatus Woesearchaeota archaeon]|nr:ATP-binding protein [Candidatus Woesearchaeota archaeon]